MGSQRLPYLLSQYLAESCSAEELQEFYSLIGDSRNDQEIKDLLDASLQVAKDGHSMPASLQTQVLDHVFIQSDKAQIKQSRPVLRIFRYWYRVAAVVLIGISVYYGERYLRRSSQPPVLVVQTDIAPGRNGATLTLANGQKIELNSSAAGQLAQEQDVQIRKTADGLITYAAKNTKASMLRNELSTARGETYRLKLPDGTMVWLNAASKISYPISFAGAEKRTVKLIGEGYFEVAKDSKHPFIVIGNGQEVQVLGTHFNLKSYAEDHEVNTTLFEGRVRVASLSAQNEYRILKPGEQSSFKKGRLHLSKGNLEQAIDWKNGEFVFDGERLESVMRKISRWYNVEISYTDEKLKNDLFFGSVSRMSNVSQVLQVLKLTGTVNFRIESQPGNLKERRIIVMR